tara:strand:- start:147 stop:455 length:309 start_codon:yes stop_codon:yes gene_type:complete
MGVSLSCRPRALTNDEVSAVGSNNVLGPHRPSATKNEQLMDSQALVFCSRDKLFDSRNLLNSRIMFLMGFHGASPVERDDALAIKSNGSTLHLLAFVSLPSE